MENWQDRTEKLIGKENINKIQNKNIAVFGVGGVGGFVVEALVRSGVQNIAIVCMDEVSLSNINRQIIADTKTLGKYKTDVFKERILNINKEANVYNLNIKITKDNLEEIIEKIELNIGKLDYIVDAIDDVDAKIATIIYAAKHQIKCISSMGAGFKLDVDKIKSANILKTKECKLAKKIRQRLNKEIKEGNIKKEELKNILAVYSEEQIEKKESDEVASMIFVPAVFGLKIANIIIKDIIVGIV